MKTLTIQCNNQSFILHPSGAVYWKEGCMLLIADVHLGKVTHFRKNGSAVPQASVYRNFEQLTEVITYFEPDTLCFLGDLFHSHINNEWILFSDWIGQLKCEVVLISGNHDIIGKAMYDDLHIAVKQEWQIDNFLLTHHPVDRIDSFNFSGHIHPGVQLRGLGNQSLKVSCFLKRENQMIFPAFGSFTGNSIIVPRDRDQVFVIADDEVIEVKGELTQR